MARRCKRWTALGATLVEFDLEPFYETARLLYEGPWVAERYLVIRDLLASSPDAIHPVTREITIAGARLTAADTFAALYRLQALRKVAERAFANIDALVLPTAPTAYSDRAGAGQSDRAQLPARHLHQFRQSARPLRPGAAGGDPARRHSVRHHAAGARRTGRAAGLASAASFMPTPDWRWAREGLPQPPLAALPPSSSGDEIAIAVVGAHLSGMALNGELKALGGRLLEAATTAPDYKLYALATTPPKPGMLRVAAGTGTSIAARTLGAVRGEFRKIRRRDPAAAVDRHRAPRRRPRRQGLSRRARRCRRRARHFRVRRLARVHGGEGGGVTSSRARRELAHREARR